LQPFGSPLFTAFERLLYTGDLNRSKFEGFAANVEDHMRIIAIMLALVCSAVGAQSNLPDAPHVYVEGTAEVQVAPDVLRLSGSISATSPDAVEAERALYEKSAILLKACKDHGIGSDQISSSTVTMSPEFSYQDRLRKFIGYELSRTFEITITNLEDYYPALRAIVESGATSKLDAIFSVSESEASMIRAQKLAVEDAYSRANRLAQDAGMSLGGVYSITEFNLRKEERASLHPQRFLFETELGAGVFEEIVVLAQERSANYYGEPLFEPSSVAVTATVFVVYLLEDK
jgi:uncharacterized protein YggE